MRDSSSPNEWRADHGDSVLWSPEFSESVDRRSIHQLAATYKTNKKTTVVFCRPSDGKVSLILKDFELRVAKKYFDPESRPFFYVTCFSFMEGEERIRLFWRVDNFFP